MKLDYSREIYSEKNSLSKKINNSNQNFNQQINSKMMAKFRMIHSILKMDKIIVGLFLFVMSINTLEARYVGHKNFENFCRNFPLHIACMGAFAGGGKRSFDLENISLDNDQSVNKDKSLIERILSDIDSYKSNGDHKIKELKPKTFEYDSAGSNLFYPNSDEYYDDLSLKQKVQLLSLLRKLSKKYQYNKK